MGKSRRVFLYLNLFWTCFGRILVILTFSNGVFSVSITFGSLPVVCRCFCSCQCFAVVARFIFAAGNGWSVKRSMSQCHYVIYVTISLCHHCRALWRLFFVCPTAICTHAWRCTYVSVQHVAVKKSHFCDCWYLLLTWSLLFSNLLSTMLQVETMRLLILGKFGRCSVPISSARNERWFWQRLKILRLILGKVGRCSLPSCCARSITPVQRKPPR